MSTMFIFATGNKKTLSYYVLSLGRKKGVYFPINLVNFLLLLFAFLSTFFYKEMKQQKYRMRGEM